MAQATGIVVLRKALKRIEKGWIQGALKTQISKEDWEEMTESPDYYKINKKTGIIEAREDNHCRYVPGSNVAYCIAGAMDGYRSDGPIDAAHEAAWGHLYAALPPSFRSPDGEVDRRQMGEACVEFNDDYRTGFDTLHSWILRAIKRAEKQAEKAKVKAS